jgi:hypothetical protein
LQFLSPRKGGTGIFPLSLREGVRGRGADLDIGIFIRQHKQNFFFFIFYTGKKFLKYGENKV